MFQCHIRCQYFGCACRKHIKNAYDVYESTKAYELNTAVAVKEERAFFAEDLCVASPADLLSEGVTASLSEAAGLFNIQEHNLEFGKTQR